MKRNVSGFLVLALILSVSTVFAYTTEQANRGKEIYTQKCAMCHGPNGEGGTVPDKVKGYEGMTAPPAAGKGALPNMKTAGNAYTFVKAHMPLAAPGSLSEKEALDVVAFALQANGIKPDDQALTPESAQKIKLK